MTALPLPRLTEPWLRRAREGMSWWVTELAYLIPQSLRRYRASGSATELLLHYNGEQSRLLGRFEGRASVIPFASPNDANVAHLRPQLAQRDVRIILDEAMVLRITLELPATAEPSMTQILSHQIERLVPLDAATVSFVWHVADRYHTRNLVSVALAIAKNSAIARSVEIAEQLGLKPRLVQIPGNEEFRTPIWRPQPVSLASRHRWLYRLLECGTGLLFCAAYCMHLASLEHQRDQLQQELIALQARAYIVREASQETRTAQARLETITAHVAAPAPLAILDALTKAIPTDSYLSEFHLHGDTVNIFGTAAHATALLSYIENTSLFTSPAFESPITASATGVGERFDMTFHLRGKGRS